MLNAKRAAWRNLSAYISLGLSVGLVLAIALGAIDAHHPGPGCAHAAPSDAAIQAHC